MPFIYILECNDKSLYTGSAIDLDDRIAKHNSGLGAKYTRGRTPVKLIYSEKFKTISEALKREKEIQKWPKAKKLKLINEKI
jgi:predicted GIY-YIG superfamily endonuclease